MRMGLIAGVLGATVACGGGETTCGPTECAAVCAAAAPASSGVTLSAFEQQVMATAIEDVRQGIRPWNDQSIGICRGRARECDEFLGATVENLPEGEYMLRAEVRVPKVGEKGTWKLHLKTECTTVRKGPSGDSTTTTANERDYDEIQYSGEEHGSRISPMYKITSPNPSGAQSCTWSLTSADPDKPTVWSGRWSVPAKE